MTYSFKFEKKLRTTDVGYEEMGGNVPEMGFEYILNDFHILWAAHIDAQQIKTEVDAVFGNVGRRDQMLYNINRLLGLHTGIIGELAVLSLYRRRTGDKDDVPKKSASLEFRCGADGLLARCQNFPRIFMCGNLQRIVNRLANSFEAFYGIDNDHNSTESQPMPVAAG